MLASMTARLNAAMPYAAATTYGLLTALVAVQSLVEFGRCGLFELGLLPSAAVLISVIHLSIAAITSARPSTDADESRRAVQRSSLTAAAIGLVALGPLAAVAVQAAHAALHPDSLAILSPVSATVAVAALLGLALVSAPTAAIFAYRATAVRRPQPDCSGVVCALS